MDIKFNLATSEDLVAPDNNSSSLQTDPNYPATLGDPPVSSNSFASIFDETSRSILGRTEDTYVKKGPVHEYDLVNRYKGTSAYSPYMNPYSDNEAIAAQNWGMWDAISTGLSGLTDNAINAGKEYAYGWVRAGRALVNFDTDYLKPSESELRDIAFEQQKVSRENPIYYDPGSNDDIFSRQFLSEFLQNTGHTFGTMAGFLTETALLGGAGKLATKLPTLFKAGAAARSTKMVEAGVNAAKVASNAAKEQTLAQATQNMFGSGIFTGKTVMDNALNVASKLPIIGAVADAGKVLKAAGTLEGAGAIALTSTELARIGAGGLKRAFSEWNFAASEAAIEAGGTYGEVYDMLYNQHQDLNNGMEPTGEDLEKIRRQAMDAAGTGYNTNFAVLAVMNKIAFGNMFRNFGTDSRFIGLLRNTGDRVLAMSGVTKGGEQLTKFFPKGYWGTIGHRSEIIEKWGRSAFYRELGRDMVRGMGRIELTEGLQENIQEGTNEFLKSYYADLYDDDIASWGNSFKEAFDSQLTKRGFKTFLQGALTGFAIRPITGAAEAGYNAYLERKAKAANPGHVDALKQTLDRLNTFMKNPEDVLRENHRSIKEQILLNEGMTKGASRGNKYQYLNNKESALISHALDAKRTGTFEAFKSFLNGYGQNLDNEEFKEATGIDLEAEGFSSASEYTSGLVQKLDRYSEIYDKYNKMFGDYLSYETIAKDSYAKQRFSFAQSAIRDAIRVAAFNEAKAESATQRAASIAQNVSKIRGIGQAAATNFNNVTDHALAAQQIVILDNEIKTLQESGPLTAETRRLIALKKKEREALAEWNETAYTEEVIAQEGAEESSYVPFNREKLNSRQRKKLNSILTKYYNAKNQQSGSAPTILTTDVEEVLDSINDFQKLDRDTKEYLNAVNLLSDPVNALKATQAYEDARVAAYARLAHDTYMKLAETSEIFADYIKANPKELENLLKTATSPFASYDSIKSVMESVAKINELVEEQEKKPEKASQEGQPAAPDATPEAVQPRPGAAVNIGAMNEDEAGEYLTEHYLVDELDGEVTGIRRYYVNSKNKEVITHDIPMAKILEYYNELGDTAITAEDVDLLDYARQFEQSLYNLQNPSHIPGDNQKARKIDTILHELKKLYHIVGKRVTYMGKPGVFEKQEGKYIVRFDDGDVIEIGGVKQERALSKKFQWTKVAGENDYVLTNVEEAEDEDSLDNYPYLQLDPNGLTIEEAAILGQTIESSVQAVEGENFNVKYNRSETQETLEVGGQIYDIVRQPNGSLISMTSPFEGGNIVFTLDRADLNPQSLDAKYIALANLMYLRDRSASDGTLTDDQLDAALATINDMQSTEDTTIVPAGNKTTRKKKTGISARRTDKPLNTDLSIEQEADRVIRDIPEELAVPTEDMMSGNIAKVNLVPIETQYKIRDWALGAIDKLGKLDPENNHVIGYIKLLNDNIIVPIAKKHGRSNTKKQPKKAVRKEGQVAEPAPRPKRRPGEPSSPTNYKPGSISEVKDQIDNFYTKKDEELAVKIDDLLPDTQNLINQKEVQEAAKIAKFTARTYTSKIKKDTSIDEDPFNNPPFSCT